MPENIDPSTMTDEELDAALENVDEPEESETPVPDAPKPAGEPDEEQEGDSEDEDDAEEDDEGEPAPPPKPKSRREELRIQQILAKRREEEKPTAPKPAADAIDYEKDINADPELRKKLSDDRQRAADAALQQGLDATRTIKFHTRLEIDAPRVEAKYPQLDKDAEEFNPQLANAINTMFLTTVGYDQKTDTVRDDELRYSTYVESIFELASEIAGKQTETTRTNIKKQAAKTGLRPDGSGTKKLNLNKPAEQMTDEELDAVIALGIPSRK